MKILKKSVLFLMAVGLVLFGCSPDSVRPTEQGNDAPGLAGSAGDAHPALDTSCQYSDTLFLANESTGNLSVDRCFGFGGVPVACASNQPKWGYLIMEEGYEGDTSFINCNFAMAQGWYCDFNNWQFGVGNSFLFDNNGIPLVGTDWGTLVVNPVLNKWQLRLRVDDLPLPCFDVALRVSAVKLNLFGAVIPGTSTVLWGKNRNWNDNGNGAASPSPWLMHFCPARCRENTPPPVVTDCRPFYTGVPDLNSCTTLSANTTGLAGTLTYQWSTGATTASTQVCPTATTTYSVTISSNGKPALINQINVSVGNIHCGNGNGHNGIHKVWVCHIPPGNPGNPQDICIDWEGVPAHVLAYRPAGSNPHMGHDSGCQIGHCGVNLCQ